MLNILKNLKEKKGHIESASDEEKGIMITTLLVEAAKSDDEFADEEIIKIKKIISNKLHFDQQLTNSIFDKSPSFILAIMPVEPETALIASFAAVISLESAIVKVTVEAVELFP